MNLPTRLAELAAHYQEKADTGQTYEQQAFAGRAAAYRDAAILAALYELCPDYADDLLAHLADYERTRARNAVR